MLWNIARPLRRLISAVSGIRHSRRVALVGCFAVALAACDPVTDRTYMDEGAGANLYTPDQAKQTALQDEYFKFICAQALGRCDYVTLVQSGMNDIDQRCDGYLTWLDARRRDQAPVLAEMAAVQMAVHSIMTITGSSPKSLNILTAAFGLASASYTQWNSRLLISVEQSTVQEVVYNSQEQYREEIKTWPVRDLPTAVYLLRNYLRLCMPITIEASINTTTRLVQRGAVEAARTSLVVRTMTAPLSAREPIGMPRRGGGGGTTGGGTTGGGTTGGGTTGGGGGTPPASDVAIATLVVNYNPKVQTTSKIQAVLRKLCVPDNELGSINQDMNGLIKVYQLTVGDAVTGKLTAPEIARLNNDVNCVPSDTIRNYYEMHRLTSSGINTTDIMDQLNLALPAADKLQGDVTVEQIRNAIKAARTALLAKNFKLTLQDAYLSDQFTPDLANALVKLRLQPNR